MIDPSVENRGGNASFVRLNAIIQASPSFPRRKSPVPVCEDGAQDANCGEKVVQMSEL